MSIKLKEENGGKVLVVHVSGKLSGRIRVICARFERLARQHGKVSMLFDMTGFHGWEAAAMWQVPSSPSNTLPTSKNLRWSGKRSGSRNGDVLQAVHESDGPILRSHRHY